jgi:UDP-N-acetylmuramoylalanine--D-glutamate ligase
MSASFSGKRVVVMGLGHFGGGVAVVRWLAAQNAKVTLTDSASDEDLRDALGQLDGLLLEGVHLAGHREEDFQNAEIVVVNPAVRPGNRFVDLASQSGAWITTELELFLRACPAKTIGVTGSNGKSTTTAMTAAIVAASGRRAWLGGNIGASLLDKLPRIATDDWVVLEISSFQLFRLHDDTPRPSIAVVTNCTPNHLDWHPSYEHYVAAKQRILQGPQPCRCAVLNLEDPEVSSWTPLAAECLDPPYAPESLPRLTIPGRHNRVNASLAARAARAAGCSQSDIDAGLTNFRGLPQRLEPITFNGQTGLKGRRFYNDSSATTPESTVAALETLEGRVWLLAGGSDKGIEFGPLTEAIVRCAAGAAFFGDVRRRLLAGVLEREPDFLAAAFSTLEESLAWCWVQSQPGDVIALSPACASKDQFQNYRQRGEHFVRCVERLAGR